MAGSDALSDTIVVLTSLDLSWLETGDEPLISIVGNFICWVLTLPYEGATALIGREMERKHRTALTVAVYLAYGVVLEVVWRAYGRRLFAALRRRLHREAWPRCTACGYNLTGNVSGCCPECGAEVSPRVEAGDSKVP